MRKIFTLMMVTVMMLPLVVKAQENPISWYEKADTTWYNASKDEFLISTPEQFAGLLRLNVSYFNNKTIKLGADIVLNDTTNWQNWATSAPQYKWDCIGRWSEFNGTFDGQGHNIVGVYLWETYGFDQGLFFKIGKNGTVKNLNVKASWIHGPYGNPAGITAINSGLIIDCSYEGNVSTEKCGIPAGIAAYNMGTILNCYSSGNIISGLSGIEEEKTDYIGGIVSYNEEFEEYGTVINCYTTCNLISSASEMKTGFVVGKNGNGVVRNCYYLKGMAEGVTSEGDILGQIEVKSQEQFSLGEVAYLLSKGEKGESWGQQLGKDNYPVLIDIEGEEMKVYKLTLKEENKNDQILYVNSGSFILPTLEERPNMIAGWYTAKTNGVKVDDNAILTADMILYACWMTNNRILDLSKTNNANLTLTYNDGWFYQIGNNTSVSFNGEVSGSSQGVISVNIPENTLRLTFAENTSVNALVVVGNGTLIVDGTLIIGSVSGNIQTETGVISPLEDVQPLQMDRKEQEGGSYMVSAFGQELTDGVKLPKGTVLTFTISVDDGYELESAKIGTQDLSETLKAGKVSDKMNRYYTIRGDELDLTVNITFKKKTPSGIDEIESVKVYARDGSLFVQTSQRKQVLIISMLGSVIKNDEQTGLKQYYGLNPGIYVVRVGDQVFKVCLK